ncbi:DUF4192 domain-containing protein [Kitasatospora sp. NPDC049285]|uniref:DUF4192 domain-containing protein n=1 Tax=Kitasatospora sp. NPDC049285 TaxID=3157096 RepID=UPI00342E5FFD
MTESTFIATLHGPADVVAFVPYHLGYHPKDAVALVGISEGNRVGGVFRVSIPQPEEPKAVASAGIGMLTQMHANHHEPIEKIAIVLYSEPDTGEDHAGVRTKTATLVQHFVQAASEADLPRLEVLLVSNDSWSSYLCAENSCCPPNGIPLQGTAASPVAVAYTLVGRAPFPSFQEVQRQLQPADGLHQKEMEVAIPAAIFRPIGMTAAHALLLELLKEDKMPAADRTATLLAALQNRDFRDVALGYCEESERSRAIALWRHLAVSSVPPYQNFAAAPLTLLAWNSWLLHEDVVARAALAQALEVDPAYELGLSMRELFMLPAEAAARVQEKLRGYRQEFEAGSGNTRSDNGEPGVD